MMIYMFAKKDNNVIRIGADCDVPEPLQSVTMNYSQTGYEAASAEEYDAQVIGAAARSVSVMP